MIKIIINADDLGLNPRANQEIEVSFASNFLSSSTIMANSDYMADVKRITEKFADKKSFGVHLNITEGRSLTNSKILRDAGMIDAKGNFVRSHNFNSRIYDTKIITAVKDEWSAQIETVLSQDIKISHIDGHHHCHTWCGYWTSFIDVINSFGIKKVRRNYKYPVISFKEKTLGTVARLFYDYHIIDAINNKNLIRPLASLRGYQDRYFFEKTIKQKGLISPDFFCSYEDLKKRGGLSTLPEDCTIELMCHPGHPNYFEEYEMIKKDVLGINKEGYKLISYNEL